MATMKSNAISRASVEWLIWQARLSEAVIVKGCEQLLDLGEVLLSIKGRLGQIAIVQSLGHPTVPGQAFCVGRLLPDASLTPSALVQYLRSAVGQTLLVSAGQRPDVAFVPMGVVKGLPIVIPSASELQRAEVLQEESLDLSREVEELSRRLQRLSRQGCLEAIPPALLAGVQQEEA